VARRPALKGDSSGNAANSEEREALVRSFSIVDEDHGFRRITDHLHFGEDSFRNFSHLEVEVDESSSPDELIQEGQTPTERTSLI
jgi:hypothetical protein